MKPLAAARTVVELLQARAVEHGERTAVTFLRDGEEAEEHLTYAQLDARARAAAGFLVDAGARGERVLLLLPTGLEFAVAFFGCLYAGAVAVPFSIPRRRQSQSHLRGVLDSAQPRLALTTPELAGRLAAEPDRPALELRSTDELARWERPLEDAWVSHEGIAYLQYTSGSTRQPRGVVIRHEQLLSHVKMMWRTLELGDESVIVTWLPLFHDMGLVGTLITPLAFGTRTVLMDAGHFMQRPARWMRCMSRYRATTTGAPNFAYDLCVSRTTARDREGLDLSRWTTAFNGAQPVRASTLERFAETFAPCGFRREAFYPCYGLAEATLLVTGGSKAEPPVVRGFDRRALEAGRATDAARSAEGAADLVGCGRAQEGQRVLIVDPETRLPCPERRVGEIWVRGAGLSTAYWQDPEASSQTFGAVTADGDGPFLRTGDLGFLLEGELFITGRLKDVLIVCGHNYHAHDVEHAVQSSHPALATARAAAFAVEGEQGESLIITQEVPRAFKKEEAKAVLGAIRAALSLELGLTADAILLVPFGSLPLTSSGKLKRHVIQKLYLDGQLSPLLEERAPPPAPGVPPSPGGATAADLQQLIREWVARRLGISPAAVDAGAPLASAGLGSVQLAELGAELEARLGREVPLSCLFSYPSVEELARFLADGAAGAGPAPAGGQPARSAANEPVAIVGMACRLPGADGVESFWRLLLDGREAVSEVPPGRWDGSGWYDPTALRPGTTRSQRGGFLERVDGFDAAFFGISDAEADAMDPQQRLLLEVAWEALEDSGLPLGAVKGSRAGVFVGISTNDYSRRAGGAGPREDLFWCTGNALSVAANRLSYAFDLKGPSLAVDTACSSSLVALHLACQSLRLGEAELAFAGGVNVMLSPDITINMSQAGAISPDGRCKAFDAGADGLVRGEGVGVVVLRPLSRALAAGDRIYAVVRGSAVNHDGRTNGLTAPNPRAQAAVLEAAYADAGVPPQAVQYVEAHGPGTPLGDPIELEALAQTVCGPERSEPCRVGSVKTNIGHLEAAAGIAGVIKVALALERARIPASLHFHRPNPRIPFERWKLAVPTRAEPWPGTGGGPRRAGVSAFGFGGTNAHAVLESFEPSEQPRVAEPALEVCAVPISAPNREALAAAARAWSEHLRAAGPELRVDGLALSAGERRTHHRWRLAISARSTRELQERLDAFVRGDADRMACWGEALDGGPGPVFVFSGHELGATRGWDRLMALPAFRAQVTACDDLSRRRLGWSVAAALEAAEPRQEGLTHRQVALFTLQVSLAAAWRAWGIQPAGVIGHSAGEISAACVAGALELEQAFEVLQHRCRLLETNLEKNPRAGCMAALRLSPEETRERLARHGCRAEIAAHNAPSQTVCAGERSEVERFLAALGPGVPSRIIEAPGPGHTSLVAPLQPELRQALEGLAPRAGHTPIFSTVDGQARDGRSLDAEHWGRHLHRPVLFREAVAAAILSGRRLFLELGARATLSPAVAASLRAAGERGAAIPSLREEQTAAEAMACAAGQLYAAGHPPSWRALYPGAPRQPLPRSAWQWKRHWSTSRRAAAAWDEGLERHPFLGARLPLAPPSACWQREVGPADCRWLHDHVVGGAPLVPTTAYLKLGAEAAREVLGSAGVVLEDVELEQGLFVPHGETRVVQTSFARDGEGWRFEVHAAGPRARGAGAWTRLATGRVRPAVGGPAERLLKLEELRADGDEDLDPAALRASFREHGIDYGPAFSRIEALWRVKDGAALARVRGVEPAPEGGLFDPGVLDACLQPMGATATPAEAGAASGGLFLPVRVERLHVHRELPVSVWSWVRRRESGRPTEPFSADAVIFDDGGQVVAELSGLGVSARGPASARELPMLEMTWPAVDPGPAHLQPGAWLVLGDRGGAGEALVQRLLGAGLAARCVVPGVEPLPATLEAAGDLAGMVDLRAVDAELAEDASGSDAAGAVAGACGGALEATRALLARPPGAPAPRLWLVTRGAVSVSRGEAPSAAQHPLWALGRAIAAEEPRVWGGLIDLDPRASREEDARALFSSLAESDGEDQVAWRGGRRHVARLAPVESRPPPGAGGLALRPDGAYLVTGGLGELGLEVARWLVRRGARRLILLGRTGLPPRAQWHAQEAGAARRRVEAIRELEARGASVHVVAVDVSSEEEVAASLEAYRREAWPEIRGVLHLAGVARPALLQDLDGALLLEHFAPKVAGAWNLHRCLEGHALDFFVLFSSGSALLGSPGIAAYAAANAFLDALAARRCASGLPALSVGWGFWAESGMAARMLHGAPGRAAPRGMGGLGTREGLALLEQLMGRREPTVGVMPFEWNEWSKAHPATASQPYLRLVAAPAREFPGGAGLSRAEVLQVPPGERKGLVEAYLRRRLAGLLGAAHGELEPDRPLTQLGIDSLMAVELKNRVEAELEVSIPVALLLQGASISGLAGFVGERLAAIPAAPLAESPAREEVGPALNVLSEDEAKRLLAQLEQLPAATVAALIRGFQPAGESNGEE